MCPTRGRAAGVTPAPYGSPPGSRLPTGGSDTRGAARAAPRRSGSAADQHAEQEGGRADGHRVAPGLVADGLPRPAGDRGGHLAGVRGLRVEAGPRRRLLLGRGGQRDRLLPGRASQSGHLVAEAAALGLPVRRGGRVAAGDLVLRRRRRADHLVLDLGGLLLCPVHRPVRDLLRVDLLLERVQVRAELGPGALDLPLYAFRVFSHCTSSFTVSIVRSGLGLTFFSRLRPTAASTAATTAQTAATMTAAQPSGIQESSPHIRPRERNTSTK